MNYEPFIEGIAKFIGAAGKAAEGKAAEGSGKGAVKGGTGHSSADVERWLGPLSKPEQQVPVIHDYLRGHSALAEAKNTGATHVREISVPVWESAQKRLQESIDADPEMQGALRTIYAGRNTPRDPDVTTLVVPEKRKLKTDEAVSVEVPQTTPDMPRAHQPRALPTASAVARKQRGQSWNEFAVAVESQDGPRIDAALENLRALHEPETLATKPGETPSWQKALDYMEGLEQQVQQWQQAGVTNEAWSKSLDDFRKQSGMDDLPLSREARDTVSRFEAWADAQKPPTMEDRFVEAIGVPRAVMSSGDLSAPGRQGLLMISRPEYWENLKPMLEAWDTGKYAESQAYIRNHPSLPAAQEAGLALTDIHSKLMPREEAFQSRLAEKIPVLGKLVRASEQAYTTFLNRLRIDIFSNSMREAAAAGVDVADRQFQQSLAEWVNTGTGRGGNKNFNPGVLSSVLFSPRLAVSRFQTFNPAYYYKMHPFVRQQAIKANVSAAATVYGLVSLAALGGAKVTWDFRNSDAGKIRIGNTRLDLGGGHFQFLRLFAQIASRQKMNSETGKVTNLGEKFGAKTGLDLVQDFIVSKEAPVASLVTDWLRGKDQSGKKFDLTDEAISRVVPLAMQDTYDALKDKGVEGLIYAAPAMVGVGVQTYAATPSKETVPFLGVRGEVPPEHAAEYAKVIEQADTLAATKALMKTKTMGPAAAKAVLRAYVKAERLKARIAWIKANRDAFVKAKMAGEKSFPLVAPEEQK